MSPTPPAYDWDLLLFLNSTPHTGDSATTVLSLLWAAVERGARAQVWACGSATALTSAALGEHRPRNLRDLDTEHPTSAALVADLLSNRPEQVRWNACRFCSTERGVGHIEGVRVRSALRIAATVHECRKTVYLGGP
ncbi:hypothetical protein [Streptomyces sp. NPDC002913]